MKKNSEKMKIRVFEAFAGYGSQAMALERLARDFPAFSYEVVGISEIDPHAIRAYMAVHGDTPNFGDISKIDWTQVPDFDLFTYSFPCTDISSAGQQRGLSEGSGTRSSLLWECRKAIEAKRPKYLLMENVKALVSDKFLPFFKQWDNYLRGLGYDNFSQVLNATDYGVPQNRERIFMVSILDSDRTFHFPEPWPLDRYIDSRLEENVSEKYYLSAKMIEYIKKGGFSTIHEYPYNKPACTCCANYYKTPHIGNYVRHVKGSSKILSYSRDNKGNVVSRHTKRVANTLTVSNHSRTGTTAQFVVEGDEFIRKMTEREYFRLMDVSEEDIDKIQQSGVSRSQQYKMAGNSIVVSCLFHIFRKMFVETHNENPQLTLF